MSPCLSVTVSMCHRARVSLCLCVTMSMCQSVCVSPCLCVTLSMCHRVYVSPCLCVFTSMCHLVYVSQCVCVGLTPCSHRICVSSSFFVSTYCAFASVKNLVSFEKCHFNKSILVRLLFRLLSSPTLSSSASQY